MNIRAKRTAGFTLIELLVVIAIIGILSSVVLASLAVARRKSRDARRVADIKSLQIALELYYTANSNTYPASLASLAPTYIAVVPTDPSPSPAAYGYTTSAALGYVLGAIMETTGQSSMLTSDYDGSLAITINGGATDCSTNAGLSTEAVYCRIP